MPGYADSKDAHLRRLRRVEGQVRGLQRPGGGGDLGQHVDAVHILGDHALQSFALELLTEHMAGCVVDAARAGDEEADAKVREAADAIARLVRS
jgi:DNA-binding FrmR family transcriptional regulator